MSVFAPALSQVWEYAKSSNIDPEALFQEAGIDPALRLDSNARVGANRTDKLLWLAKQKSHDDAFAIELADQIHPSYLGAMGYAWLTSATLRRAFGRLERYIKMLADELTVRLEDDGSDFLAFFKTSAEEILDPAMRERLRMAMMIKMCRMNCGQSFNPSLIRFEHSEPPNADSYFSYFRCELEFDSEQNTLVLPISLVDQPLPGFDAHLVTMNDKMIVEYLARMNKSDISGRARAAILEHLPSGDVSIDTIAGVLNMSVRSLSRKLNQDGLTFKGLLAEIRRDLGERYIHDKSLTLTEISFLLGFSDTSSFSRAYKAWTGNSPSAARSVASPH